MDSVFYAFGFPWEGIPSWKFHAVYRSSNQDLFSIFRVAVNLFQKQTITKFERKKKEFIFWTQTALSFTGVKNFVTRSFVDTEWNITKY